MQNYEALFVPGLLQTAECTRAIIESVAPTVSEVELDNLVRVELRAHTQALNALRETQLEQGRKIDEQGREMREGFATLATGMAQITALLTNLGGTPASRGRAG